MAKPELDIARNVRTIEWLKTELINGVAMVFRSLMRDSEEAVADALANVVMTCYLLARRVGIGFAALEIKVQGKVKANVQRGHEIEKWYGDFSALERYFEEQQSGQGSE